LLSPNLNNIDLSIREHLAFTIRTPTKRHKIKEAHNKFLRDMKELQEKHCI